MKPEHEHSADRPCNAACPGWYPVVAGAQVDPPRWQTSEDEHDDQPPEVTTVEPGQPGSLPPLLAARDRVAAFIRWFGDGTILDSENYSLFPPEPADPMPPLYARDLEVLVKLAELAEVQDEWRIQNADDVPSFAIAERHPLAEHYSYLVAAQGEGSRPERRTVVRVDYVLAGPWQAGDPPTEHRVGDTCERNRRGELSLWWNRGART